MKHFIRAIISLCLLIMCATPVADAATPAEVSADGLYQLGLFKGTGTDESGNPIYALEKTPTRNQAIIMLVRLLGKEDEALTGIWDHPFTDVPSSMSPYIGYAYQNGLTNGKTATTFDGTNSVTATQYLAFLLRALGYESGVDFSVSQSWKLSNTIGLTLSDYSNMTSFTRGHVAVLSYAALRMNLKSGEDTLLGKLISEGSVSKSAAESIPELSSGIIHTPATAITPTQASGHFANGKVTLEWYGSDEFWYHIYEAPKYSGPYTLRLEVMGDSGKNTADFDDANGNNKYYKIQAYHLYADDSGKYIHSLSNFTEPITPKTFDSKSILGVTENIRIIAVTKYINSVGGVEPNIYWANHSGKTIKYITFTAVPYNAVGDIVSSEIGGHTSAKLQVTGPIETFSPHQKFEFNARYPSAERMSYVSSNEGVLYSVDDGRIPEYEYKNIATHVTWDPVWYNYSAHIIKITRVDIEYMDGTTETIKNPTVHFPYLISE